MNTMQRGILSFAAMVVAIMLLFPPFRFYLGVEGSGRETNIGYSFILKPPVLESPLREGEYPVVSNVNWPLLLTQWAGVMLVAGLLCLATKNRS